MFRAQCMCLLAMLVFTAGCSKPPPAAPKAQLRPEVTLVDVQKRNIMRISGQPGFIEAYEQTSIYPKISGFVDDWKVDIGDKIEKKMLLAHLDVPDLVAEYEEKKEDVKLAVVKIGVAQEMVKVATENKKNAAAQVEQAKANLGKAKAYVAYREAEYKRIKALVAAKSLEKRLEDESKKDLDTSISENLAVEASIVVAQANEAARQADVSKAKVDVAAAQAQAAVARAMEKRYAALVDYTYIKAPYAGIVVARNVSTGDFVQPAGGDRSSPRSVQDAARSGGGSPLYVVARTDKIRIFLDVSEMEAAGVHIGNKAWITIEAVDSAEIAAEVARTSWSLDTKTRTLRAEVDVPNPGASIRPNMYAFGNVEIIRKGVWAVPLAAVTEIGNQTCCYEYEKGKAMLLPVQRGIDDGQWAEVARKRIKGQWQPFDGSEKIVLGDLSQLSSGEPVRLEPAGK